MSKVYNLFFIGYVTVMWFIILLAIYEKLLSTIPLSLEYFITLAALIAIILIYLSFLYLIKRVCGEIPLFSFYCESCQRDRRFDLIDSYTPSKYSQIAGKNLFSCSKCGYIKEKKSQVIVIALNK